MDFKIEVLKHPTEEDWQWVKRLALNTVGKDYLMDKEMSLDLKKKYLKSEHSPIRYLHLLLRWKFLIVIQFVSSVTRWVQNISFSHSEMIDKTNLTVMKNHKVIQFLI